MPGWEFWIDKGGTFTDVIAKRPDGSFLTYKLLSANPGQYQDAPTFAIRHLLKLKPHQPIPARCIDTLKMGTTLATNALLEKKGEPTALVTTKGFGDMLRIGYQYRPDIFALQIELPTPLYCQTVEIDERILANGDKIKSIDRQQIYDSLTTLFQKGIKSLAIVLLHSYQFPAHEQTIAKIAKKIGFQQISVSHEVSPRIKIVTRGNITVIDAYLTPLLKRNNAHFPQNLQKKLFFMQSHGGLTTANNFRGKNSILSGPAAGLVAAVKICSNRGIKKIITFDMGGTSTDVAHFSGQFERQFEADVAGYKIQTPMLAIETIASGGGSILNFAQDRFQVGPKSAGADPGPTCYGKGGPLAITDCHVLLGRLQPEYFPKVFGKDGTQSLDLKSTQIKFEKLLREVNEKQSRRLTIEQAAEGFIEIAVIKMANAIKKISIQRGYDLAEYTLCCFGGAGAQHACRIADLLTIPSIFIPKNSSVLSAYGLGLAETTVLKEKSLQIELDKISSHQLATLFTSLNQQAARELQQQTKSTSKVKTQSYLRIKYRESDFPLDILFTKFEKISSDFEKHHRQFYGYILPHKELVLDSMFVEASTLESKQKIKKMSFPRQAKAKIAKYINVYIENKWQKIPLYLRELLQPGEIITGPAIIIETYTTTIVENNWQAIITSQQDMLITKKNKTKTRLTQSTKKNPIDLEIFNHLFSSIAEEMGTTLAKTAYSVNIKERLDYSCAIFDQNGNLIANAQHIPVHLGSMSESVKSVIKQVKVFSTGDAYINNNPYAGGTHLPDVTLVSPVIFSGYKKPLFFVASRGHHADIGGLTPGSMPPFSKNIHEEGVLINCTTFAKKGKLVTHEVLNVLSTACYPARNPAQNIADLKAQLAANQKGVLELKKLIANYSAPVVLSYVNHMKRNATQAIRNLIPKLKAGHFCYSMDNHCKIAVKISIDNQHKNLLIDFEGTSPLQKTNNLNAPHAVSYAAVLYVFRTLLAENIPLNEGVIKPIKLIIPKDCLLNPVYPAAIVAGNVETSQCIVDTLYGALNIMAASQGTMNNLTFGNRQYQYYETLCGGSGAGPGYDGVDAIHTHMTNSRLTDPEVLELKFPIVVESFSIRKKSGGKGRWRGGNGIIRKIRFKEPMTAAIISNRRKIPPYGMAGGEPGKTGKNWLIQADGKKKKLQAVQIIDINPDDILVIETPGGGGYGEPTG
jgi:5-oxoprolinase (ATP-hydrolysing)